MDVLKKGKNFLKFGRRNLFGPSMRKIYFNEEMSSFYWVSLRKGTCGFEKMTTENEKTPKKKFDLKVFLQNGHL